MEAIKNQSKEVDDKDEIAKVGAISAADSQIGETIAEAVDKVGKDGVITVEESNTFGMELDFVEGMRFDKGYISPYFITDPERMEAVLEDPYILIANSKVSRGEGPAAGAREGHAGRQAGPGPVRGRRGRGPRHAGRQQDPRHVPQRRGRRLPGSATAARPCCRTSRSSRAPRSISEEVGLKLESATIDLLGTARKVIVTKDETTIVEGAGKDEDVQGRINQIKSEIEKTDSDYDREKLQERLAKLSGGVAVIKVGAATEVELKEKKHRIEDAVQSTKAAVEEGIVPGGGVALLNAQAALDKVDLEGDELTGAAIVRRALEEPLKQIAVQRRPRGRRHRREGARAGSRVRAQRRHRRVRRHAEVRRDRPDQGHAFGAAERRVDRRAVPDDRGRSSPRSPRRRRPACPVAACPAGTWTSSSRHHRATARTGALRGPVLRFDRSQAGPQDARVPVHPRRSRWPAGIPLACSPRSCGAGALRRVLLAFFIFNAAEWAVWLAVLVYAFTTGGTTTAGVVALLQLIPAALVAPLGSVDRGPAPSRPGARARLRHPVGGHGGDGHRVLADAPPVVVFIAAIATSCSITLTGPCTTRSCRSSRRRPKSSPPPTPRRAPSKGSAIFVGPVLNGVLIGLDGPWLVFAVMSAASVISALVTVHCRCGRSTGPNARKTPSG